MSKKRARLPPDFIGIIDEHGEVLIDDTAYFRHRAIEEFRTKARRWFAREVQNG